MTNAEAIDRMQLLCKRIISIQQMLIADSAELEACLKEAIEIIPQTGPLDEDKLDVIAKMNGLLAMLQAIRF